MKQSNFRNLTATVIAIGSFLTASTSFAAGPILNCTPGVPFLWGAGGADVPFNTDMGSLGILDNTAATGAVEEAFQAWEDVDTATITYENTGQLPVDVDATNFVPFLQPVAPDGLSAIVFDDTGEIFDLLFGVDSGVLGFAGPEWINPADCTIFEGVSFLNGPAIGTLEGLLDLMVHEFGHYSNLAHTEVNGQLFIGVGDSSGPGADNTFGDPPFPDGIEIIATMYPFLFGNIDQVSRTPNPDDIASLSQLYPEPDFAATTGTITGTIIFGDNKFTGVNVIARNVDDPFFDAVSGISSDFTEDFSQAGEFAGLYTLNNLTPGADYAVYVDEILAGGFSTPLSSPLPGPEEFYNGDGESSDALADVPNVFVPVTAVAGTPQEGIDILFNIFPPGAPLPTGDDGNVQVPLPFSFCVAGQPYDTAHINGNGFFTLGAPAAGATFAENAAGFVTGPPRFAGLWDDLSPNEGGSVFYEQTRSKFTVVWDKVPEFGTGGSNTFKVTLRKNSRFCEPGTEPPVQGFESNDVNIRHGRISATDGLVGVSVGSFATSGFEREIDLSATTQGGSIAGNFRINSAFYELFSEDDFDIPRGVMRFRNVGLGYRDVFERNNSIQRARRVRLPFDTINTHRKFSSISPAAGDIDFYRFKRRLSAGTSLVAEILTSQVDTVMGLFLCDTGPGGSPTGRCDPTTAQLVAGNDDSNGLLSRIIFEIPVDGTYALAVTFCCDFDFDGVDPGQGPPLDSGRYVLDAFIVEGSVLPLTDESFQEIDLGFEFPFQGSPYGSVFVNSNGYLSFGGGETGAFLPNVPDFEAGLPRIAPLWVDLDPTLNGMIVVTRDSGAATISYLGVPEFFFGGSNTFSTTLDASGNVQFSYSGMTAPGGISGLAEGGGSPGTPVDLSSSPTWPGTGTTFEQFQFGVSEFDLDGSAILFEN